MLNFYPHLTIRNHTYYARFSVPKHLVKIAKRKNFFYSLFTKDYYQALHKVKEYAYKTDLLIQSYERKYQEMLKLSEGTSNYSTLLRTSYYRRKSFIQILSADTKLSMPKRKSNPMSILPMMSWQKYLITEHMVRSGFSLFHLAAIICGDHFCLRHRSAKFNS